MRNGRPSFQLGRKTVCIERAPGLGGAGLATGCIPSKLLLRTSEIYAALMCGELSILGIDCAPTLDLSRMMDHKDTMIEAMAQRMRSQLDRHGVTVLRGDASLVGPGLVRVREPNGRELALRADHVVVATGSEPIPLPKAGFDHRVIVDSAGALSLRRVPRRLAVVGGGATGVELGTIWQRLGAQVTIIERQPRICPWLDDEISATLEGCLRRRGMELHLSTEVIGVEAIGTGVHVQLSRLSTSDGAAFLEAEMALVAIGRRPAVGGLGLENVGLRDIPSASRHAGGGSEVPGIWFVGDAAAGRMLAHKQRERRSPAPSR